MQDVLPWSMPVGKHAALASSPQLAMAVLNLRARTWHLTHRVCFWHLRLHACSYEDVGDEDEQHCGGMTLEQYMSQMVTTPASAAATSGLGSSGSPTDLIAHAPAFAPPAPAHNVPPASAGEPCMRAWPAIAQVSVLCHNSQGSVYLCFGCCGAKQLTHVLQPRVASWCTCTGAHAHALSSSPRKQSSYVLATGPAVGLSGTDAPSPSASSVVTGPSDESSPHPVDAFGNPEVRTIAASTQLFIAMPTRTEYWHVTACGCFSVLLNHRFIHYYMACALTPPLFCL